MACDAGSACARRELKSLRLKRLRGAKTLAKNRRENGLAIFALISISIGRKVLCFRRSELLSFGRRGSGCYAFDIKMLSLSSPLSLGFSAPTLAPASRAAVRMQEGGFQDAATVAAAAEKAAGQVRPRQLRRLPKSPHPRRARPLARSAPLARSPSLLPCATPRRDALARALRRRTHRTRLRSCLLYTSPSPRDS